MTNTGDSKTAIVERLRHRQKQYEAVRTTQDIAADFRDGADEIERLYLAVEVLLGEAENPWPLDTSLGRAVQRALDRGALNGSPDPRPGVLRTEVLDHERNIVWPTPGPSDSGRTAPLEDRS